MDDAEKLRIQRAKNTIYHDAEAQREAGGKVNRKRDRIRRRLNDRASNLPTPEVRRDADLDERIFKAIKGALASGDTVKLTGRSGDGVSDMREAKRRTRHQKEQIDTLDIPRESTFYVPHWDHTGDRLKALSWGMAVLGSSGYTLNMNLGPEVISAAKADKDGFASHLRERISRHLRRALQSHGHKVPDFFFAVEASYSHAPHLHGGIIIEDPALLPIIRNALKAAAGAWKPHASQTKVQMEQLKTPVRWVGYVSKWRLGTAIMLGDKNLCAATQGMRARAKKWYNRARITESPLAA